MQSIRSDFRGARVDKGVLAALVEYRPVPSDLFPNLRCFRLASEEYLSTEDLPFLQRLLGPSMLTVHVFNDVLVSADSETYVCSLFRSISQTSPRIREISIRSPFNPVNVLAIEGMLLSLSELKSIQVLDMPLPPRAVVDHLGALGSLECWDFLVFPADADLHSFTTRGDQFPNLHRFGFCAVDIVVASEIVQSMNCPFEWLEVICRPRRRNATESLRSLRRMTEVLSRHRSLLSLSHLTLDVSSEILIDGESSAHVVLCPLFRLGGLKHVKLKLTTIHLVGDVWFEEASQAWPYLETLRVTLPSWPKDWEQHHGPSMTLAGLIPLLQRCPRLSHLEVSLIAKPIDPSVLSGISGSTVYRVSFPFSAIESPREVYQCMAVMFPKIRAFDGYSYRRREGNDTAWGDLGRWILDGKLDGSR